MEHSTNKKPAGRIRLALFTGAVSLLLTSACLVGTTFAWFNATVTSTNVLTIGSYSVTSSVESVTGAQTLAVSQLLPEGVTPAGMYNLKVTARGDSTGFARIRITAMDGSLAPTTVFTPLLAPGDSVSYSLNLGRHAYVEVASVWSATQTQTPLRANSSILYGVVVKPTLKEEDKQEDKQQTADAGSAETTTETKTETPAETKAETKIETETKPGTDPTPASQPAADPQTGSGEEKPAAQQTEEG